MIGVAAFTILSTCNVGHGLGSLNFPIPLIPAFDIVRKMANNTRRNAQKLLDGIADDFNMNINYQLKKIGLQSQLQRIGIETEFGSENTTRCYGLLGCLEVGENWYGLTRPVNALPQERNLVNTQFILRTRSTMEVPKLLQVSDRSIYESSFNGSKPTVMIVHGFIDDGFVPWVQELGRKLLFNEDVNVIAVDWGGGSSTFYSQSAANTRLVALEASHLIRHLATEHGSAITDFHIIGHSLGAHIAGYTGEDVTKKTGTKIGRITGLDPAEPLFTATPRFVRLDPGDASFVDVIHTDARGLLMFGYGMTEPVGHVDFYPNGGSDQPGCSLLDFTVSMDSMANLDRTAGTFGRHAVACHHNRAIELYIDSLDALLLKESEQYTQTAFECSSYEEFTTGSCFDCGPENQHCAKVGHLAIEHKETVEQRRTENMKFYYNTGGTKPFCQHHYLLELSMAKPEEAEIWVQGHLKVNLHGSKSEITNYPLTHEESLRLVHGSKQQFLLSLSEDLGAVKVANLEWNYDHDIDPLDLMKVCVLMCSDKIFIGNIQITSDGMIDDKVKICGDYGSNDGYSAIESSHWKLFYKPCNAERLS